MKKRVDISVIIMVAVIAIFVVLGGIALAPTVGEIIANRESDRLSEHISNGTATVEELANSSGMKYDEFVAQYELKTEDVPADTTMTELMEKLTLKNYCAFMGLTYTDEELEAYKAENEDAKDVTADTTDIEAKNAFVQYLYAKQQAASEAPSDDTDALLSETEAPAEAE